MCVSLASQSANRLLACVISANENGYCVTGWLWRLNVAVNVAAVYAFISKLSILHCLGQSLWLTYRLVEKIQLLEA